MVNFCLSLQVGNVPCKKTALCHILPCGEVLGKYQGFLSMQYGKATCTVDALLTSEGTLGGLVTLFFRTVWCRLPTSLIGIFKGSYYNFLYKDLLERIKSIDSGRHQAYFIKMSGQPAYFHPRWLPPHKLWFAKEVFDEMLHDSIILPSDSSYISPLHLVPKPNGSDFQICVDYRRLNTLTIPDSYPVLHIHNFMSRLQGATIFSKIDLKKAYYQVPVTPEDIPKTAVTTFSLDELVKMPFSLRNAAQTFQMKYCMAYLFTYIDDILIASGESTSHKHHLHEVLQQLSHYSFRLSLDKWVFGSTSHWLS